MPEFKEVNVKFLYEFLVKGQEKVTKAIIKEVKALEAAAERTGKAIDEALGSRPTDTVKSRVRKSGRIESEKMADALGKIDKKTKSATSRLDRFIFGLGKLRFGINVTQFAFQTLSGLLGLDKLLDFESAISRLQFKLGIFGVKPEKITSIIDAIEEGLGKRKIKLLPIITADLDADLLALLEGISPATIKRISRIMSDLFILGIEPNPAELFRQLLRIESGQGDVIQGLFDDLLLKFGFSKEAIEKLKPGKLLDALEKGLAKLDPGPAQKANEAVADLSAAITEFQRIVVTPLVVPTIVFAINAVTKFIEQIVAVFDPKSSLSLFAALSTVGLRIGTAILLGVAGAFIGGPVGAVIGGLAGFALGDIIANALFGDIDTAEIKNRITELNEFIAAGIVSPEIFEELDKLTQQTAIIEKADLFGANIGEAIAKGLETFLREAIPIVLDIIVQLVTAALDRIIAQINKVLGLVGIGPLGGKAAEGGLIYDEDELERVRREEEKRTGRPVPRPVRPPPGSGTVTNGGDPPPGGGGGGIFILPPFAHGGIIPGPVGVPRMIVAHGGEAVLTPAQQQGFSGNIILMVDKRVLGELNIESFSRFSRLRAGLIPGTVGS